MVEYPVGTKPGPDGQPKHNFEYNTLEDAIESLPPGFIHDESMNYPSKPCWVIEEYLEDGKPPKEYFFSLVT
jgi:hypothetical protein